MTDYHLYWTGTGWSTSSSALKAIPPETGFSSTVTIYCNNYVQAMGTDKITQVDTGSCSAGVFFPPSSTTAITGGTGSIPSSTGIWSTGAQYLKFRHKFTEDGTYSIQLAFKYGGQLWIKNSITCHYAVETPPTPEVTTTLTLQPNYTGGSTISETISTGDKTTDGHHHTRTGYTNLGYYTSASGGTKILNAAGSTVSGVSGYTDSSGGWIYTGTALTLYAHWEQNPITLTKQATNCSISIKDANGSTISTAEVGDTIYITITPNTGYEFSSGSITDNGGTRLATITSTTKSYKITSFTAKIYVIAKCTEIIEYVTFKVKAEDSSKPCRFRLNDGSWPLVSGDRTLTVEKGDSVKVEVIPDDGRRFDSWDDGNTSNPRTWSNLQSDKTVYAAVSDVSRTLVIGDHDNLSIEVKVNGTVRTGDTISVMSGDAVVLTATPNTGYDFEKWVISTPFSGTSTTNPYTYTVNADYTISAVANATPIYLTLIGGEVEGATTSDGTATISVDATSVTSLTAPTCDPAGYVVEGYCTDASLSTTVINADGSTVANVSGWTDASGKWTKTSSTATLYTKWTAKAITVTLDANGGTVVPTVKVVHFGEAYGDLPTPTWEGYAFVGWFTASTGGTEVTSEDIVEDPKPHTLYAQWMEGGVVCRFDANGGHCDTPYKVVATGMPYGTLPDAVRESYDFLGWYDASQGGSHITASTTVTAESNHTLYAHWQIPLNTFTVKYNANGGSGAPSQQTATERQLTYTFVLSSTVPTKTGKVFAGWATTSTATWPEYIGGANVTLEPGTLQLYAVWVDDTPVEGTPKAYVRIYNTVNGRYIDVTDRLTVQPTVKEVENYGTTASFTVVNDVDTPANNLLSPSCSLWSSGSAKAIDTAMFVTIRHGSQTGMQWAWFYITSIDASDDLVTITCGDYIQWLRAAGSEYYRNHYDPEGYDSTTSQVSWYVDGTDEYLAISKPSNVTLQGGSVGDVKIMVPGTASYGKTDQQTATSWKRAIWTYVPIRSTIPEVPDDKMVAISSVTVRTGYSSSTKVAVFLGDTNDIAFKIAEGSVGGTSGVAERTLTLTHPVYVGDCTGITIQVSTTSVVGAVCGSGGDGSKTTYYTATSGTATEVLDGVSLDLSLDTLVFDNASGAAVQGHADRWKITSVASGATIDETLVEAVYDKDGNTVPRGWIEFYLSSAGVSLGEIVRNIVGAAGGTVALGAMNRSVQMFRCAGGHYHDYLLTLADMTEDGGTFDGRQHSFCASQSTWGALTFGLRKRSADAHIIDLYYAREENIPDDGVEMMSFDPRKTKQYRPSLAVSRGLNNDGQSIIVCVKDPNVSLGSSVETLESTDTSSAQAALNAYTQIMTNRSTQWEGTVVLDGIRTDAMHRLGQYIGGAVVRIKDGRYGMNATKCKVKEAVYDYQNLTTTLTINNYSEVYSNSLNDTSKMAYQTGTLSIAESSVDMYTRQFVFLEVDGEADPDQSYQMKIVVDGTESSAVDCELITYPELGIATIVGYFAPGSPYSSNRYAVTAVKLIGATTTTIPIDVYHRPDKRDEQYLIVNIQTGL